MLFCPRAAHDRNEIELIQQRRQRAIGFNIYREIIDTRRRFNAHSVRFDE